MVDSFNFTPLANKASVDASDILLNDYGLLHDQISKILDLLKQLQTESYIFKILEIAIPFIGFAVLIYQLHWQKKADLELEREKCVTAV